MTPVGVRILGRLVRDVGMEVTHADSGAVIRTAPPRDNGGDGSAFSPTDLCAASLGSSAVTTMALYARRTGIPIDGIDFALEKDMHPGPRRLERLIVRYRIATRCTVEEFERLESVGKTCPVRLSLGPQVEVDEVYERA